MTIESAQVSAALDAGGTVVVPTRQRAVALRLAHTRALIGAGAKAWKSCDIIPWSAWLDRCAEQARHAALRSLRRLGAAEEWLLWREAAVEACEGSEILRAASLGEALRRSSSLERDWGLRGSDAPMAEAQVLRRAREGFLRRCQDLGAYSVADWTVTLREARSEDPALLLAGFDGLGSALAARLTQLGGRFVSSHDQPSRTVPQVVAGADRSDELRRAALWCRHELERNPAARLLVVVPQLATVRALALQAFEHTLQGGALLSGSGEALCAIEGGQSLADFPLVSAALALLGLASGPLEFKALAPLLRSPYVGCGPLAQRLALELSLRERNVHEASLASLIELARARRGAAGSTLPAALAALLQAITPVPRRGDDAASWARRYAGVLEAGGWPGARPLGSEEQQQRDRFRDLLGELALIGAGGALLGPSAALELLCALAARTAFDPASGDAPVTLTDSIDDPLVLYDGIWVAGLGAENWAPPARPDPFVPVAAQRAVGVPAASAEGQRRTAGRAMDAWGRCACRWVLSWPQHEGDVPLQPSSLLQLPARKPTALGTRVISPALPDMLVGALRAQAVRERRPADRALAWAPGRNLAGGTRALLLQSQCPFRAVAELRLGAAPVLEPSPGLGRLERGQILHRALELVWRSLRDSRALRARAAIPGALGTLARAAAVQALREGLGGRSQPLAVALVQNEQRRLQGLIARLLQQELQRAAAAEFSIAQLEDSQDRELGGQPIRVRMDRVDRLDDGRVIVIDYKSGAAKSFRPLEERPRQPQLLAYALLAAAGEAGAGEADASAVAGIAAVHLNADEIRWRGAAADRALLPALSRSRGPTAPWPELLRHWRRVIDGLVGHFVAGESAVDPLPEACRSCHLPALCRIDATRQAETEAEAESAAGGEDAGDAAEANDGT